MTLRQKIVSLTLAMLLLFAMTAAASLVLQHKITVQFSGVIDDYLPLSSAVATGFAEFSRPFTLRQRAHEGKTLATLSSGS